MPKILLFLLFFIVPFQLKPQILPREGSVLNYRLVGFSFPAVQEVRKYTIEIAPGYYNRVDSFAQKIKVSAGSKDNRMIAEVPSFGSQYTWRVVYSGSKMKVSNSPLYHFNTGMNAHVDTGKFRMRIIESAMPQYKDDYVAVDGGGVLYDMKGRPVWYIPDTNGFGGNVADLKFTHEGTITFIYRRAYDINYDAGILWQTPDKSVINGDTVYSEFYHHEFTKLTNGHYMALGTQILICKTVSRGDSSYIIISKANEKTDRSGYKQGRFGCLIEYDQKGNVVWSWETSKYLLEADFAYFNPKDTFTRFDPHDNAFLFDEKSNVIYLGFRNLNRIIKIEYPSGKILRTYGDVFKPGAHATGEGLFCGQHSIGLSEEGYLYYFNNNSCLPDARPTVVMLKEPATESDTLKKVWEYTCTVDGSAPKNFNSGGNAIELPDRSLFIDMGSAYSKLFIVNRDKKILWSALPEKYLISDEKWAPMHEYRANIINRKDLERLIWNAETSGQPIK